MQPSDSEWPHYQLASRSTRAHGPAIRGVVGRKDTSVVHAARGDRTSMGVSWQVTSRSIVHADSGLSSATMVLLQLRVSSNLHADRGPRSSNV